MVVKNQKMIFLKSKLHQGTKGSKPYLFYDVSLMDDEQNTIKVNLSNELCVNKALISKMATAKLSPCSVDLVIYQSGFSLKGTVVRLEIQ